MSSTKVAKAAKAIAFTAKANENHNYIKVKNVIKWLKLGHEVRVQINGKSDQIKAMENVYNLIQNDVKSGARFLQKVVKPDSIKFTLRPNQESSHLMSDDTKDPMEDVEGEISGLVASQDIFSEEFEEELSKSIKIERSKNKKNNKL